MNCFQFLLLVCLVLSVTARGDGQPPLALTAGQVFDRELKAGQTQSHPLTLAVDTYLNLTVTFQGVNLQVRLHDPAGQLVAERRGGIETLGTLEIALVTTLAGPYQLEVRGQGTGNGKYQLEIRTLRAATEADRHYSAAHQLIEEGNALAIQRTAETRRQALAKYRAALPLWQASGQLEQELETLRLIADAQYVLAEYRSALAIAQEFLAKGRAAGLRYWELKGLKYVGSLQNSLEDNHAARQTLEQALALSRELKERLEERAILNSLGITVAAMGQRHAALEYYQQALVIAREIGDRTGEATMLRNLAVRYEGVGEPEKALVHYEQALAMRRQLGARDGEAVVLLDLARLRLRASEVQAALEMASQARATFKAVGRKEDEASALIHMGRAHAAMREFELARADVAQALALYRSLENRRQEAVSLRVLSSIQRELGDVGAARQTLQAALKLNRSLNAPSALALDLLQLGVDANAQNEPQQASAYLQESLALSRKIGSVISEAQALIQLSRSQRALGEPAQARASLLQALTLSRSSKSRLLEAEAAYGLAALALQEDQLTEAQTQAEAALDIIETSRSSLANPLTRAEFRSNRQSYYEVYLEALLRRREREGTEALAARALEVVEQSRARSLLEMLTEARVDIRQGVNDELLNREYSLQQRLATKVELLQQLSTAKNGQALAKVLDAEITTLAAELRETEAQIRRASPAYAALTQPQPLKLTEIQREVLDRETVLLEYALGRERSYLFVATTATLQVFTLPKRADIEAAARRYHGLLSQRGQARAFSSLAEKQNWFATLARDTTSAATSLSELILPAAVAAWPGKRWLIVPDGVLHYVPFAALPLPTNARGKRPPATNTAAGSPTSFRAQPLIATREILTLPSASTLAVLRRELARRTPAPKLLAVLADPVFSASDERVRKSPGPAPVLSQLTMPVAQPESTTRFVGGVGGAPRLPASRREAEAILALVPVTSRKAALDFTANQQLVQSEELKQYRYLHFATHGLLNTAQPELSGLLLSQVDESGQPQPGLLTTQEVYRLKLPAELVVLSGCRTGLGKEINSEGLVGLTRGFMYAGARRVLASLWQVDDAGTAELMKQFYTALLRDQKQTPAAALRAAQLAIRRHPRWRDPYFWAGFVLQGEW